jgi:hypothetical protein
MKDLQKWAERVAPTLTHNDWRDVERDAYAGTDEAERFSPDLRQLLTDMDGELPDWLRKEIEKRILDTVNS